jgi:peroxiredoxin
VESVRISDFSNSRLNFATGATAYSRQAKEEALLLPRMRRDLPPQQVIIGRNGDLLRGHLEAMTRSNLQFRTGLESVTIPKERLSAVVWLQKEIDPAAEAAELQEPTSSAPNRYWIDLNSGGRLEVSVEAWDEAQVLAQHPWLGQCRIPRADIHRIHAANPVPTPAFAALADWRLRPTQDPVIPGEEGSRSPLLGKEAPDFTLPDLAGNEVPLTDLKDKVVVLDFWATWCGPCVRSLPGLIDAMEAFSPDEVSFFAVNQGENSAQVKRFLEARRLAVAVLLDHDQSVGREYGAEAIPHTVIIAPSGKISFVKTGAGPDGNAQITEAVRAALAANES